MSKVYYSRSSEELENSFKQGKTTCIMKPFTGFQDLGTKVSLQANREGIKVEEISFFCATKNKKGPTKDIVFNVDRVNKNNDFTSLLNIDIDKINDHNLIVQEQNTELKKKKGVTDKLAKAWHRFTWGIFQRQDTSIVGSKWDRGSKLCFPKGEFKLLEGKTLVLDKSVEGIGYYFLTALCVRKDVQYGGWWNYDSEQLLYVNLNLCEHRDTARIMNVDVSKICYVVDSPTSMSVKKKTCSKPFSDGNSPKEVVQSVDFSSQPLDDSTPEDCLSGSSEGKLLAGEAESGSNDL